jgi:Double zinc ribbon
VPEPEQTAPLLARLEAAQARTGRMENMTYWAFGGLAAVLMIAAPLQQRMRKKVRALKLQIASFETRLKNQAPHAQATAAQPPSPGRSPAEQSAAAALSQAAAVADATSLKQSKEQRQDIHNASGQKKAEPVAVNAVANNGAQSVSADVVACAQCKGDISIADKFCMHCGASAAAEKRAPTMRLCSCCREEIGASDKFCRHCGASCVQIAAPSMTMNGTSTSSDCTRSVGV